MSLKETIKTDLFNAQKKGDRQLVAILKLLWSEIGYLMVEKQADDKGVLSMFKKEARKRKDAIEIYEKAGDKQRMESEMYELSVIKGYLPKEMGEDEVRAEIAKIAKGSDLTGGRLIGEIMKSLGGKADGKLVAKIVGEI